MSLEVFLTIFPFSLLYTLSYPNNFTSLTFSNKYLHTLIIGTIRKLLQNLSLFPSNIRNFKKSFNAIK